MSKQLSLSAAFSIFAMAALALSQGGVHGARPTSLDWTTTQMGATTEAAAPTLLFGSR